MVFNSFNDVAITTLILFSVLCGLAFFYAQVRLRLIHKSISGSTKKDFFTICVFLPVNLLVVGGPHFLLIYVEAWQEISYGRVLLVAMQIMAAVSLAIVLLKNKSHTETT